MSAIRPLQNSLDDVIGVWSESRKVVSCSACLELLHPVGSESDVVLVAPTVNGFDGRCMSIESAPGGLDAVSVGAVLNVPLRVGCALPIVMQACRLGFHHRSEVDGET